MRVKNFNPTSYLLTTLVVILLVTLLPNFGSRSNKLGRANLTPFREYKTLLCVVSSCDKSPAKVRATLIDVFGNITLFVPFGVFTSLRLKQRRRVGWLEVLLIFGSAFLFSTAIEIGQLWLPTRCTNIDDIIFNSSGALLGVLIIQLSHTKVLDYICNPLRPSYHPIPSRHSTGPRI